MTSSISDMDDMISSFSTLSSPTSPPPKKQKKIEKNSTLASIPFHLLKVIKETNVYESSKSIQSTFSFDDFDESIYYKILEERKIKPIDSSFLLLFPRQPLHCPRCFYVWSSKRGWMSHIPFCSQSNKKQLRMCAIQHEGVFFKPRSQEEIENHHPSTFPSQRLCSKILNLKARKRKGEPCLRVLFNGCCPFHGL